MTDRPSMYALKQAGLEPKGITALESGYYETKDGDTWVGVSIWFGPPSDPETGEELDRSYRWQARKNGRDVDPYEIWPYVCARPISLDKYIELLEGERE